MQQRLASLYGLRAISIIGILYTHASITPSFSFPSFSLLNFLLSFITCDNGVNIFFVISGFLINNLLISEETRNHRIDSKAFYIRRVFRILPVYFFMPII
jgi:peptidoglycan/LPS O-acetylase OafA/YrhL